MVFGPMLLLVSAVSTFYYSYKYTWLYVIHLFETFNHNPQTLTIQGSSILQRGTPLIRDPQSPFVKLIVQEDDHNSEVIQYTKKLSRLVFSGTIATTLIIVEFILIQFLNKGDNVDHFSMFIWDTSILLIVLSLIFVQPLIVIMLMVNKFFKTEMLNKTNLKLGASAMIMILWILCVIKFDTFTDFKDGSFMIGLDSLKLVLLHKISVIGITLIAILNGIGSVSTFYYYLYKDLMAKTGSTDQEAAQTRLRDLKRTLDQTENMIKEKEAELAIRDSSPEPNLQKRTNIQPKGSFLDLQILNRLKNKDDELSRELRSLIKIKNDLFNKILKMESSFNSSPYMDSNTSYYKSQVFMQNLVQKSLAVYCIFKIIQVTVVRVISFYQSYNSGTTSSVKESDPLIITISRIVKLFITVEDEDFLVNQLSFFVSGGLFFASFNGVFITLRHMYKFIPIDLSQLESSTSLPKNKSVSIIKNLIISELMGIYGLATLLTLRSSLSNTFRTTLMALLSTAHSATSSSTINVNTIQDIHIIDNWFDKVFLASAALTSMAIWLSEVFNNDGFESHDLMEKVV